MNRNANLLIVGGILIVLVLLSIIVVLRSNGPANSPTTQPSASQEESGTAVADPQVDIPYNDPDTVNTAYAPELATPTTIPGTWYSHQGLSFRLPPGWKPQTDTQDPFLVTAQPESAQDVTDLPRLQIVAERPNTSEYIPPSRRYANYQPNRSLSNFNGRISAGYRNPPVPTGVAGSIRPIQDIIAILESDTLVYTIRYQYKGSTGNSREEETFQTILESLQYQ